jgi:hypothetical protein
VSDDIHGHLAAPSISYIPSVRLLLSHRGTNLYLIGHISLNPDMSLPSSSSSFQSLFDAALQDYAKQTGTKLDDQPLTKQIQDCNSVDAVSSVLQGQAERFHQFRGEDGKIMKSFKPVVHVLYNLSTSGVLGEGVGVVRPQSFINQFYL